MNNNVKKIKNLKKELKLLNKLYYNSNYNYLFASHNNKIIIEDKIKNYENQIASTLSALIDEIKNCPDDILRQILLMQIDNKSIKQIAKELNYTESYIKFLIWRFYNANSM